MMWKKRAPRSVVLPQVKRRYALKAACGISTARIIGSPGKPLRIVGKSTAWGGRSRNSRMLKRNYEKLSRSLHWLRDTRRLQQCRPRSRTKSSSRWERLWRTPMRACAGLPGHLQVWAKHATSLKILWLLAIERTKLFSQSEQCSAELIKPELRLM